jgi:hypothetical protein
VYNSIGEEVATLFDGYHQQGKYVAIFDGSKLTSGIYFYKLRAENFSEVKRLILMK